MRNAPTKGSHIVPMEKILVIEDDRAINKALKHLLESEGFTVDIAPYGAAVLAASALRLLDACAADGNLNDVKMM